MRELKRGVSDETSSDLLPTKRIAIMIRRRLIYVTTALLLIFAWPTSVWADTVPTDSSSSTTAPSTPTTTTPPPAPSSSSTAPSSTTSTASDTATGAQTPTPANPTSPPVSSTGPSKPTGADANTYTYNSGTGLWENQYYTWNPVTHQTAPKTPQSYSYNPSTGMWDTTKWVYDAPSGKYVPNVVSTASPPVSALKTDNVATPSSNSTSTTNTDSKNSAIFDLFYNARISNSITQTAQSGDASVIGNTVAGNALTGNALDVANIINMLEASFGLQNAANLLTFTDNIDGDVVGDLYIDPNQLSPSSIVTNNSNTQNNVTINAGGSGLINNDITLDATSGNATVASNTNAGDATSGNANAVANIVNMLNSAIAANQSFLGVININGNLDGDILLPPNFIDQLLASNAPHTTVNLSDLQSNNLTTNSTNNQIINNDVNLAAASGDATVDSNTSAGSAKTGNGNTNLTIFNLTGRQVTAKDSLIVFVNVLGKWVGLIMDAPAGTTAAAVGGNVTRNNTIDNNATINENTNNVINNNVKVTATTGDAKVANNTNAGDATTGNATASANIANIIDSQLSLSDWFGLLFINVLGYWHGSFGINTAAGNVAVKTNGGSGALTTSAHAAVFRFVPGQGQNANLAALSDFAQVNGSANGTTTTTSEKPKLSLAAAATKDHDNPQTPATTAAQGADSSSSNTWILPLASFVVTMALLTGLGSTGEWSNKIHARILSYKLGRS